MAELTAEERRKARVRQKRKEFIDNAMPYLFFALLIAQVFIVPYLIGVRSEQSATKTRQLQGQAVVCAGQLQSGVKRVDLPARCLAPEVTQYYNEDFIPTANATSAQLAAQALKNRQIACIVAEAVSPDAVQAFENQRGEKCADPPRVP